MDIKTYRFPETALVSEGKTGVSASDEMLGALIHSDHVREPVIYVLAEFVR